MKKYLNVTFILVTAFLLFLAFDFQEISGARITFGDAKLNDTTTALVTLNKGMLVNGEIITKFGENITAGGDVLITNGIYRFGDATAEYGQTGISGSNTNGEILYTASQHHFWNNSAAMFTIDSATGTNTNTNFTKLGASAPAIKMLQVTGKLPAVNNFISINHGLSNVSKVLSINWTIRDDSLNWILPPGYNASTGLTTGFVSYLSATQFSYYVPPNSVNLPGDTIRALITYIQ